MPPRSGVFIDANLLVLRVIGAVDRRLIGVHRRVSAFGPEHYERLLGIFAETISSGQRVYVTPNTLTETSNLVGDDPRFQRELRLLIEGSDEVVVASVEAARHDAFERLGLTDAVLLESVSAERPLVTADASLYQAVIRQDPHAAFNFWHEQAIR